MALAAGMLQLVLQQGLLMPAAWLTAHCGLQIVLRALHACLEQNKSLQSRPRNIVTLQGL